MTPSADHAGAAPARLDGRVLPGHLAENVVHFARVLRDAGLPVGTDRVALALQALPLAGVHSRRDFRATLEACLVDRAEHRLLFDQAFTLFWRRPDLAGRMMALMLPQVRTKERAPDAPPENRRLAGALFPNMPPPEAPPPPEAVEMDALLTVSDREVLRKRDFDTMTADEWRRAREAIARMAPQLEQLRTRRQRAASHPGRPDARASLQAMARHGGELWQLRWRRPRTRPAPLVVLADISGSMGRYSRMLLHFAHALAHAGLRSDAFVFGTRLTPIGRLLRQRDPDLAVAEVSRTVQDWSGGTRIGDALHAFNRDWARRVLGGGATVLLVTDGLERGDDTDPACAHLAFEAERLAKSCRRLLWLNPLLRHDAFEPRAAGMRALRPQVDALLPVHDLASLEQLAGLLADPHAAARASA